MAAQTQRSVNVAHGATGASSQAKEDVVSEGPPWRGGQVVGGRTWGEPRGRMLDPEGRCGGWRRTQGGISPACTKPPGAGAGAGEDECFACAQSSLASARWLPGCWVGGRGQARQDHCAAHVGADVARGRFKDQGRAGPGAGAPGQEAGRWKVVLEVVLWASLG